MLTTVVFLTLFGLSSAQAQTVTSNVQVDQQELLAWCNDVQRILTNAQERAFHLTSRQLFSESLSTLKNGLVKARGQSSRYQNALTYLSLTRALSLLNQTSSDPNPKLKNHLALTLYDHVQEVVATVDYYFYDQYCESRVSTCFTDYPATYESEMVTQSRRLLEILKANFFNFSRGQVYPLGNLNFVRLLLRGAVQFYIVDMQRSLHRYHYACDISLARDLVSELSRPIFANPVYYTQHVYSQLEELIGYDQEFCSYPLPRYPR